MSSLVAGVLGLSQFQYSLASETRSKYNINYRQVPPVPPSAPAQPAGGPSLPSDYWWPFQSTTADPTLLVPATPNEPAPPISTSPTASDVLSTLLPSSTGDNSSAVVSQTSSLTTFSISALPPSTTSSTAKTYPKLASANDPSATLNHIIIPVCVVLGAICGAFTTWFVWGCLKRKYRHRDYTYRGIGSDKTLNFDGTTYVDQKRKKHRWGGGRRRRESELEVGPRYSISDAESDDNTEKGAEKLSVPEVCPSLQASSTQSTSKPGDADLSNYEWPSVQDYEKPLAKRIDTDQDVHSPSKAASVFKKTLKKASTLLSPTETDIAPLLDDSPARSSLTRNETIISAMDSRPQMPWESLRHKSIKREILEKVQNEETVRIRRASGTNQSIESPLDSGNHRKVSRRHGHIRASSDLKVTTSADRIGKSVPLAHDGPSVSRANTSASQYSELSRAPTAKTVASHKARTDSVDVPPLTASKPSSNYSLGSSSHSRHRSYSQGIEASDTSQGTMKRAFNWATAALSLQSEDKFTPAPTRRSASPEKRHTRSEADLVTDEDSDAALLSSPRDFLPQSPALVSSPPLESQLYFTPIVSNSGSFPISPSSAYFEVQSSSRAKVTSKISPKQKSPSQTGRNLQPRSPPRLPFPSGKGVAGVNSRRPGAVMNGKDIYRGKLMKPNYSLGRQLAGPASSDAVSESAMHATVKDIVRSGKTNE